MIQLPEEKNPAKITFPLFPRLSDTSKKDIIWEKRRIESDYSQSMFLESDIEKQEKRGKRIRECASFLLYKVISEGDKKDLHKLRYAQFCHVRLCPICQWRRALTWQARFYSAWPQIIEKYSTARYIHLVLTIPNCPIKNLKDHLKKMSAAWKRMTNRNTWPALGFLRSVEVTRGRDGNAHPHYHVLLMVPDKYFKTSMYMSVENWRDYWASALGVPSESLYPPFAAVCSKNMRKGKGAGTKQITKNIDDIAAAVCEVVKYAVKGNDIVKLSKNKDGRDWFRELDIQISGTKSVITGGVIKEYINSKDITSEEMLMRESEEIAELYRDWRYDWFFEDKSYLRTKILSELETINWDQEEIKKRDIIRKKVSKNSLQNPAKTM